MNIHTTIDCCPITNSPTKYRYFSLGNIPLVNNLCESKTESLSVKKFPLNIVYYPSSGLSSLDFAVDSKLLFSHYLFKSEVNIPYYTHCQEMFAYLQKYVTVEDNTKIIDIGGNDGTLLDAFKKSSNKNFNVLNFDPSENLSKLSIKKGIPTNVNFFSYETANELDTKFDIIVSTNVFQHLKDINSFVKGINHIISDNGIWSLEFPYWIHDMITNQFDQIYHEHIYYYSIKPLKSLFEKHNMKIINITKQNIHGGTIRLIIAKENSKFIQDQTVNDFLSNEEKYNLNYHINWGNNIHNHIEKSSELIKRLKNENKTIYGFGAAAKGCIYLNAMGINNTHIDYIIDDTDIKQEKFVPGTGIKIVNRDILKNKQPDYILILAHNFCDYIINSLKSQYSNKFILLIPDIRII